MVVCDAQNSFHGRTYGSMAVTTSKTYYRQGFAPLMPQVVVAPYPYCLHCKVREAHPEGDSWYKVRAVKCTSNVAFSLWRLSAASDRADLHRPATEATGFSSKVVDQQ